jgi:hypothetical protein
MAVAGVGAGWSWALWHEFPAATNAVDEVTYGVLEPMMPVVFGVCLLLFVVFAGLTVYTVRDLRPF